MALPPHHAPRLTGHGTTQTGYRNTSDGCKGGNWYFEQVCGSLEIPKIQQNDFPRMQTFHHIPRRSTTMGKWSILFKNTFDSLGSANVFAFCQNSGSSKIIPWRSPANKSEMEMFCGGGRNLKKKLFEHVGFRWCAKMTTFWNSVKLRYDKIIFFWSDSMFLLAFLIYFDDKYGVYGPSKGP